MPIPYTKPHLRIPDQLLLLESRGMTITNRVKAADHLRRIGYYRLSGYWYPCRNTEFYTNAHGKPSIRAVDNFRAGTTFAHAVDLCIFDKKLRLMFMDAFERIEVSLRVEAALLLSAQDPQAHRNAALLDSKFTSVDPATGASSHSVWLQRLETLTKSSREEFVGSFHSKYSTPLPIWIAIELWDFGTLSHFLGGMKPKDGNALAKRYALPHGKLLVSFVRNLNIARNVCAHHGRFWNKVNAGRPMLPKVGEVPVLDHILDPAMPLGRLYVTAAITQHFMKVICPHSQWATRLKTLLDAFPKGPGIEFRHTGFPANWKTLPLWQ